MEIQKELEEIRQSLNLIVKRLDAGEKKTLTVEECAEMQHVTKWRVYHLIRHNRIPYYKNGCRRVWFDKAEIEEWQRGYKVKTNEEIIADAQAFAAGMNK